MPKTTSANKSPYAQRDLYKESYVCNPEQRLLHSAHESQYAQRDLDNKS